MDKVYVSYRVDERLTIRGGYNREKKKKFLYKKALMEKTGSYYSLRYQIVANDRLTINTI